MKTSEEIWHAYHDKFAAFLRGRVPAAEVDDILQEVFVKIHSRLDSLKESARLESWLYRIVRNAVIDYYRARKPSVELPEWLAAPQAEEDEAVRRELSQCLDPMIAQLPEKYRVAIRLSELEGKSQQQVAELERLSLSGAKSRVQRGRALLKGMLHDCCRIELDRDQRPLGYEPKPQGGNYCKPK